ncbi:hypothetical protein VP01_569g11 [Puccinia sorghi]|uniref:Protein-tyrosine phosphatase n=1 Tax=Puccinia sorghi TaxID=27349 RepID=A0A0L6UIS7_9BASI|nr:hypothetical protein VP01_569g11 [Puccinia sorghi]
MKISAEPFKNPPKLREIYLLLEQREVERRTKTLKKSDGHPYTAKVAQLAINRLKNRSVLILINSDIYPYDTNRLLLAAPIHGNDYINASWISEPVFPLPSQLPNLPHNHHPLHQQPWIAAQVSQIKKEKKTVGPLPETCYEFFSLCLDPDPARRPRVIIQLTAWQEGGREKCACYLPGEVGGNLEFRAYQAIHVGQSSRNPAVEKFRWASPESTGDRRVRVTLESSEVGPVQSPGGTSFYRKNSLLVELQSSGDAMAQQAGEILSQARVVHYECIAWPDQGVPDSVQPILELIASAKAAAILDPNDPSPSRSPILVHCSAGVGRTGTLITIASCSTYLHIRHSVSPHTPIVHLQPPHAFLEPGRITSLTSSLEGDLVAYTVDFLREQRVCMVQTEAQLGFVYQALAESLA